MDSFGFLKVAAAVPHVRVGDCDFNTMRKARQVILNLAQLWAR